PRFWVTEADVEKAVSGFTDRGWLLAFRGMTNVMTNSRNVICSVLPRVGVGNSAPLLRTNSQAGVALLLAGLNSFVFDYAARQKIGGGNLNFFIVEQLPVPRINAQELLSIKATPCVLELIYTAWDVDAFA